MAHLWYPYNLRDVESHPAWIQFNWFDRKSPRDRAPKDTIQLYMPEQASQPATVNWETERFGLIGHTVATAARTGMDQGRVDAAVNSAMSNVDGMADVAATRALAKGTSRLASILGGQVTEEGLIGEVTGKIPNPYLTYIFRGVDFRTFTFVFKFYPYREQDCEVIDEIIRIMRANSLPHYKSGDAFLGYPCECDISYKWRGKDNIWLHKFKPAVCTGIDVDYTSQGMFSVMRNGFPSEITMSTKWSEIEIVTREDVEDRTKRY